MGRDDVGTSSWSIWPRAEGEARLAPLGCEESPMLIEDALCPGNSDCERRRILFPIPIHFAWFFETVCYGDMYNNNIIE